MRAARPFECFKGVMTFLLSALQLQVGGVAVDGVEGQALGGCEREGVVEGRQRIGAVDVELEVVVEPGESATVTLTASVAGFQRRETASPSLSRLASSFHWDCVGCEWAMSSWLLLLGLGRFSLPLAASLC